MWIEARLLERVKYGFVGGPSYRTTVVEMNSGVETTNAERDYPKHNYIAGYEAIKDEYHEDLLAAFHIAQGRANSFRFKDWADYQLNDVNIGSATGDTDEEMQIVRRYDFGGSTKTRPITRPVDSTVYNIANGYVSNAVALSVTADDTPVAFTVDYDTGILTLNVSAGQVIRVTGEFDVPVRFGDDDLLFAIVNWRAKSTNIELVEVIPR